MLKKLGELIGLEFDVINAKELELEQEAKERVFKLFKEMLSEREMLFKQFDYATGNDVDTICHKIDINSQKIDLFRKEVKLYV